MQPICDNLLLVFAKFPQPGQVKTRLAKTIGDEKASQLYHAFLADLAPRYARGSMDNPFDVKWIYVPMGSGFPTLIEGFLAGHTCQSRSSFEGYQQLGLAHQQQEQLGWAAKSGYRNVVIVSTDSPHLPQDYITTAFELLNLPRIVLGPTYDGGYCLLGTPVNYPVLERVKMSTNHVAEDIIASAEILGLSTHLLPPVLDVDEEADLIALAQLIKQTSSEICPATSKAMDILFSEDYSSQTRDSR